MKALFLIFLLLFQLYPDLSQAAARIPAKSAILVDMDSGKVLYEKMPTSPSPASLTKIMTMYLALDMVGAKKVSLNKIHCKIQRPPLWAAHPCILPGARSASGAPAFGHGGG